MNTLNPTFAHIATSARTIGVIDPNPDATFDDIIEATKKNFNNGHNSRHLANSLFARAHGVYTRPHASNQRLSSVALANTKINDTVTTYMSVMNMRNMQQAQMELTRYVHEWLQSHPRSVLRVVFIVGYEEPVVFQLRYQIGFANTVEYRVETWDFQRVASGKVFDVAQGAWLEVQGPVFSAMRKWIAGSSLANRGLSHTR